MEPQFAEPHVPAPSNHLEAQIASFLEHVYKELGELPSAFYLQREGGVFDDGVYFTLTVFSGTYTRIEPDLMDKDVFGKYVFRCGYESAEDYIGGRRYMLRMHSERSNE